MQNLYFQKDKFNNLDDNEIIEKIKNGVHPGGILLLHAVSDTNTKVLKQVLSELQKEGYVFKSLNELP